MDDIDRALIDGAPAGRPGQLGRARPAGRAVRAERHRPGVPAGGGRRDHRLPRRGRPGALGRSVAALVGVHLSDTSDQDAVTVALQRLEEVEDCWFVAGDEASWSRSRVPDVAGLERTLSRLRRIRGVARTRTTVVLSTKWEGRDCPAGGRS